ncbi:MAG: hypothetical protein IPQ00_18055 [Chloracidobacterium sp.]|nr:hypothetical protein [Chloracidobacterium sp.]
MEIVGVMLLIAIIGSVIAYGSLIQVSPSSDWSSITEEQELRLKESL